MMYIVHASSACASAWWHLGYGPLRQFLPGGGHRDRHILPDIQPHVVPVLTVRLCRKSRRDGVYTGLTENAGRENDRPNCRT